MWLVPLETHFSASNGHLPGARWPLSCLIIPYFSRKASLKMLAFRSPEFLFQLIVFSSLNKSSCNFVGEKTYCAKPRTFGRKCFVHKKLRKLLPNYFPCPRSQTDLFFAWRTCFAFDGNFTKNRNSRVEVTFTFIVEIILMEWRKLTFNRKKVNENEKLHRLVSLKLVLFHH